MIVLIALFVWASLVALVVALSVTFKPSKPARLTTRNTDNGDGIMRIRIHPEDLREAFEHHYPHPLLRYVDDTEECDWLLYRNCELPPPSYRLGVPKKHYIGWGVEPLQFLKVAGGFVDRKSEFRRMLREDTAQYMISEKPDFRGPWRVGMTYFWYQKPYTFVPWAQKTKCMSLILSNKMDLEGHRYRHALVTEIIHRGLPIDIWGKGSDQYKKQFPRHIKGEFDRYDEPYKDYQFTITIENSLSEYYMSEKLLSPISFNTIPLYYGASRVSDYLGDGWGFRITGVLKQDLALIEDILRTPAKFRLDLTKTMHEMEHGKAWFPRYLIDTFGSERTKEMFHAKDSVPK